jgi:hypothetical protein
MGRAFSVNGEKGNAYRILVGRPERNRPLRRQRCKYADTIEMDLLESGWSGMGWIGLVQDMDQWKAFDSIVILRIPGFMDHNISETGSVSLLR